MEKEAVQYRLELKVGNSVFTEWSPINLQHGEKWEETVVLPLKQLNAKTVEAILYRLDKPQQEYRRTLLWIGR